MSRGQRKHATIGVQKHASEPQTDYSPNQRVMTVDGYLGVVTAVTSTRGTEEYSVTLDGGMGGGTYTAAQITAAPHEAVGHHMASDDYPILQSILNERPDIATPRFLGDFNASFTSFTPGQRVMTFDGLTGTITAVMGNMRSSFTGSMDAVYAVVLDNGLGGGEYSANDLRPQTGVNTPIMHQADITSGSQMDGSFDDTSTGDGGGSDYHEEGGDLQTGAGLHKHAASENTMVTEDMNDSWGQDGDDSTNHVAAATDTQGYATYKNPYEKGQSWKQDGVTAHKQFEPEHHPIARERHYPMGGGGDVDHNSSGNPMPEDVSKKYEPPHLYSLNALDFEFASTMREAQLELEAAVNNSWGDPEPTDLQLAPKPFGATQQKDPKANPGSMGFASQGDPEQWVGVGPGSFGHSDRLASANKMSDEMIFEGSERDLGNDYEFMFEAASETPAPAGDTPDKNDASDDNQYELNGATLRGDEKAHALHGESPLPPEPQMPQPNLAGPGYPSGPKGGQGGAMPPGEPGPAAKQEPGAEATLHDEPEAALPSANGAAWTIEANVSMGESDGDDMVPEDDQALTPARTAGLASIVEAFQKQAGYLLSGGGAPSGEVSDIAAAAKEHLAKTALRDYSPAEQASLINEGAHASAKNLDRLQLEGTHYLEDEDDQSWLS